jgi:hypothetical protein
MIQRRNDEQLTGSSGYPLWRTHMSEAINPQIPGNPMDQEYSARPMDERSLAIPSIPAGSTGSVEPDSQASAELLGDESVVYPPGLVFFAGIMILLLGGFETVWAIVELFNVAVFATATYGTFDGLLWLWAILDLILAAAAIYAGYDILRGGTIGRVLGVVVAGANALRWFFYLPASPWVGIVMIAVDIIIIYALVAHGEYFHTADAS